jgi:hypothetical protein
VTAGDNDASACCLVVVDAVEPPIEKAVHHMVGDAVPRRNKVVTIVERDSLVLLLRLVLLPNMISWCIKFEVEEVEEQEKEEVGKSRLPRCCCCCCLIFCSIIVVPRPELVYRKKGKD